MNEARPVAQVQNPVKPPEFVPWMTKIRPQTKEILIAFSGRTGFSMQDILDVALLDYVENFEKTSSGGLTPEFAGENFEERN